MGMKWRPPAASGTTLAAAAALLSTAVLGISSTTTAALGAPAPAQAMHSPSLKLIAAQREVTVGKYGSGPVYFDPGIWTASMNAAFQLDVAIAHYGSPETVTEVIRTAQGVTRHPLPSSVLDGWTGLAHFGTITVRTPGGRIVGQRTLPFCPDTGSLAKTTVNSAGTSPFPQQCAAGDPFGIGEVWGLARGWAADTFGYQGFRMNVGTTYTVTETIGPRYAGLFQISPRNATATVQVKVVRGKSCGQSCELGKAVPLPAGFTRVARQVRSSPATRNHLPNLGAVPLLRQVPANAEPDLIPTPAWQISVNNTKKKKDSYLNFASTVWIGGNGPLDVEGFRIAGTTTMRAYQYFYRNGKVVGRVRAGTMGFASYNAWHFKQFAQYLLLNAHRKVVVRSRKVGFCIAPTDSVDLLLRHATWQPSYTGISGNCGDPTALWVTETLPLGWGDTYVQTVPYQSFDITDLPNGTYYIEVVANPEHLLHETNTANDISLRKVIVSGTAGHRHVRVPAFHGIDPQAR